MMERQSNFELMRIVAMFLIVAHHYYNATGGADAFVASGANENLYFLKSLGSWGKMAINPFVLLSGYFMCTSSMTAKRFLKVLLEWLFYSFAIYVLMVFLGYETLSVQGICGVVFASFYEVDVLFTASFVWFYLGIPFYNMLIKNLDRRGLYSLTGLLVALFVVPITLFGNDAVFHHVFWYMTLYFVAACIRLYPMKWMESRFVAIGICAIALGCWAVGSFARVFDFGLCGSLLAKIFSAGQSSHMISFVLGVGMFLFFKNLNIRYSRYINMFASCMFGVLCIHASSNAMRTWLWHDVCHVPEVMSLPLAQMLIYAILSSLGVMIVCSIIDLFRQAFIENPILKLVQRSKKIECVMDTEITL